MTTCQTELLKPMSPFVELVLDPKFADVRSRLDGCLEDQEILVRCTECGWWTKKLSACNNRYCKKCYKKRYARIKKSLSEKTADFRWKIWHFILTIPNTEYSKDSKRFLEDSKRKFLQILKRDGLDFEYFSCVDYGNPKSTDPLETNLHIHMGVNLPAAYYLKFAWFQERWARATGIDNAVFRVAQRKTEPIPQPRSKNSVIRYIAARAAGNFGHEPDDVFFPDLMDLGDFMRLVYRSRYLVVLAKPISGNVGFIYHKVCPLCEGRLDVLAVFLRGNMVFSNKEELPPDYYAVSGS